MFPMRCALLLLASVMALPGAGWRSLFDGQTTAGWREVTGKAFPSECWRVEKGCLRTIVTGGAYQDIRTADTFGSFEFSFEWKVTKAGNSGVKYLVQHPDEWVRKGFRQARARGLEYQLCDDANEEVTRDASRGTAGLYSALAPVNKHPQAPGEWNASRIIVNGRHVEHWLNGVRVLAFTLDDAPLQPLFRKLQGPEPEFRIRTPISLQNHASEAWFRNLKIRELE